MTEIRLGLWGPSESGKTAYLCALNTAENVRMEPRNTPAHTFMHDHAEPFREGKFPQATMGVVEYHFGVSADPSPELHGGLDIDLHVVDSYGGILGPSRSVLNDGGYQTVLSQHFARAGGLLYFYDPLSEENLAYLESLIRVMTPPTREGAKAAPLEQFVAVCVAKFDDPRVFERARAAGFVPEEDTPSIPEDQAAYFRQTADPAMVAAIRKHFHEKRIQYFAISSVGFRRNAAGIVNPSDYANVTVRKGEPQFRKEEIKPINLLEPLTWLERGISNQRRRDRIWRERERAQAEQEHAQSEPE